MSNNVTPWSAFEGPNLGYVMEQYDLFLQSPEEVEPGLVALFEQYGEPIFADGTQPAAPTAAQAPANVTKILAAMKLAEEIRHLGHLAADIYPLKDRKLDFSHIEPKAFGLTDADLAALPATIFFETVPAGVTNGKQAVDYLSGI